MHYIILKALLAFCLLSACAHGCRSNSDCDSPMEYCANLIIHQCRPCRDLCAPQYPDSHAECSKLCPDYQWQHLSPATPRVLRSSSDSFVITEDSNAKQETNYTVIFSCTSIAFVALVGFIAAVVYRKVQWKSDFSRVPTRIQHPISNKM